MKKIYAALIVSLASATMYAATPALIESLIEYESIINAIGQPGFTIIPPTEFIIDIRRLTHDVDVLGKVKYEITTRVHIDQNNNALVDDEMLACGRHSHTRTYVARLLVEPNPGIGPNSVTVLSIRPAHH